MIRVGRCRKVLFPRLDVPVYLNHAAVSPLPAPTSIRLQHLLEEHARDGLSGVFKWSEELPVARQNLATLLRVQADDVCFVPNTSAGLTHVAQSFPWNEGDRILLFEDEFPANVVPWKMAARRFGLTVHWSSFAGVVEHGLGALEDILHTLREVRPRLVAVSAVQFQTGLRIPLEALAEACRQVGAVLVVDAIQGLGALPLYPEDLGIDIVVAGGHKWLMGPTGSGVLWMRRALWDQMDTPHASWLSQEDPFGFLEGDEPSLDQSRPVRRGPVSVEAGMINYLGHLGLGVSAGILHSTTPEAISAHAGLYLDQLEQALVARGFTSLRRSESSLRSTILAVLPPEGTSVSTWAEWFRGHGISISTPDGRLRFAPHLANALSEVSLISELLENGPD